jgi:hypothetical protein
MPLSLCRPLGVASVAVLLECGRVVARMAEKVRVPAAVAGWQARGPGGAWPGVLRLWPPMTRYCLEVTPVFHLNTGVFFCEDKFL